MERLVEAPVADTEGVAAERLVAPGALGDGDGEADASCR
jgi:hypothetical protein